MLARNQSHFYGLNRCFFLTLQSYGKVLQHLCSVANQRHSAHPDLVRSSIVRSRLDSQLGFIQI
jgi:hypothetical protein